VAAVAPFDEAAGAGVAAGAAASGSEADSGVAIAAPASSAVTGVALTSAGALERGPRDGRFGAAGFSSLDLLREIRFAMCNYLK